MWDPRGYLGVGMFTLVIAIILTVTTHFIVSDSCVYSYSSDTVFKMDMASDYSQRNKPQGSSLSGT